MIKKIGPSKYKLFSKDGSKNLGTADSLEAIKKREAQVNFFKYYKNRIKTEK